MAAGALFQDAGRPGWRRFGVPPSGAFDRESCALALALAGSQSSPAIELIPPGAGFEAFEEDRLAVVGAPFEVLVNGSSLGSNVAFSVRPGDRIDLLPPPRGLRAYLASRRGWRPVPLLQSASGQSIPEILEVERPMVQEATPNSRLAKTPSSLEDRPLRVLAAPQTCSGDLEALAGGEFQVSLDSNRVGVRFLGSAFAARPEIVSEPSVVGAVQVTPSGELIVHGPDGPTIGGYPKIAIVIEADLDRLAQLAPLQKTRFANVDPIEAETARAQALSKLRKRLAELRAAHR